MTAYTVKSCWDFLPPAALPPVLQEYWVQRFSHLLPPLTWETGGRQQSFLFKSPWRFPFGWVPNIFCVLVEPLGIQAKLHVGQSEITVNYLYASCPVPCSFQYGIAGVVESGQDVSSSCYYNLLLLRQPSLQSIQSLPCRALLDLKSNAGRTRCAQNILKYQTGGFIKVYLHFHVRIHW